MIESSIYCAKVRDLRMKIMNEMVALIKAVENITLVNIDISELKKIIKRAAEFSTRFQRIRLYQIQRVIHDINRHNYQSLPYAQHTQFQAQMVRVVGLHQNTLQAFQVFHKSLEQTLCLKQAAEQLQALAGAVRDGHDACAAVVAPHGFSAAKDLFDDELAAMSCRLDSTVTSYQSRASQVLAQHQALNNLRSKKSKPNTKKSSGAVGGSKTILKAGMEKLSMYSLEPLHRNEKKGKTAGVSIPDVISAPNKDNQTAVKKKSP
ncbi:uncharacterized protein LOC113238519, partial [Hyposmocoma kahamanoa]|uniref:uncharacterized protein LOC113238519 n=1 Tax=Hyposmocoma kahamanoa TaxID=1477025 RepID=UPI000E6D5C94